MIDAIAGDVSVVFTDWGEDVVLRVVTRAVDARTGVISESSVDTPAVAIFSASALTATPEAARSRHRTDLTAVVRSASVPAGFGPPRARLLRGGIVYEVASVSAGADGVLTEFVVREA